MAQTDQILFVGHDCLVVTLDGVSVLVNANFSNTVYGFIRRRQKLATDPGSLRDIAVMAVTDAHYDHLDFSSYKFFSQELPLVTPVGTTPLVRGYLTNPVVELKPWMSQPFGSVTVHAVPALHRGFRLSGLRYTSACGYVIAGNKHAVYVSGDTGYGTHFEEIAKRFKIDAACLPIGSYGPAWLMKNRHLSPEEALRAADEVKARHFIPTGWGAFPLSLEPLEEPLKRLKNSLPVGSEERVKILNSGEVLGLG